MKYIFLKEKLQNVVETPVPELITKNQKWALYLDQQSEIL